MKKKKSNTKKIFGKYSIYLRQYERAMIIAELTALMTQHSGWQFCSFYFKKCGIETFLDTFKIIKIPKGKKIRVSLIKAKI